MDLITVLIVLVVVGVFLYIVETQIPLDAAIRQVIRVVVILVVAIWILRWLLGYDVAPVRIR